MNQLPQDLKILIGRYLLGKDFIAFIHTGLFQNEKIRDYILTKAREDFGVQESDFEDQSTFDQLSLSQIPALDIYDLVSHLYEPDQTIFYENSKAIILYALKNWNNGEILELLPVIAPFTSHEMADIFGTLEKRGILDQFIQNYASKSTEHSEDVLNWVLLLLKKQKELAEKVTEIVFKVSIQKHFSYKLLNCLKSKK